ncbi:chalcone isomerase family protein [Bacteriovoracales bacterium]|nr:chalcone isomerase family protein [Bacteriovoracales bacterium]
MKYIIIFIFFLISITRNHATETSFPSTIKVLNKTYKLIGSGLLEYSIFKIDVYKIAFYKSLKSDCSLLKIIYEMDIEKNISNEGWKEGLKKNLKKEYDLYKKELKWIKEKTPNLKEKDQLIILRKNNMGLFIVNKKIIAKTKEKNISKLLHLPWLGPNPIDEDLKKSLLGQ